MPLTSYAALQKAFTADIGGAANRAHIGKVYRASMQFLAGLDREPLRSRIANKKYFAFRSAGTLSRPVNAALFAARSSDWEKLDKALLRRSLSTLNPDAITKIVYSVAMAF